MILDFTALPCDHCNKTRREHKEVNGRFLCNMPSTPQFKDDVRQAGLVAAAEERMCVVALARKIEHDAIEDIPWWYRFVPWHPASFVIAATSSAFYRLVAAGKHREMDVTIERTPVEIDEDATVH